MGTAYGDLLVGRRWVTRRLGRPWESSDRRRSGPGAGRRMDCGSSPGTPGLLGPSRPVAACAKTASRQGTLGHGLELGPRRRSPPSPPTAPDSYPRSAPGRRLGDPRCCRSTPPKPGNGFLGASQGPAHGPHPPSGHANRRDRGAGWRGGTQSQLCLERADGRSITGMRCHVALLPGLRVAACNLLQQPPVELSPNGAQTWGIATLRCRTFTPRTDPCDSTC